MVSTSYVLSQVDTSRDEVYCHSENDLVVKTFRIKDTSNLEMLEQKCDQNIELMKRSLTTGSVAPPAIRVLLTNINEENSTADSVELV